MSSCLWHEWYVGAKIDIHHPRACLSIPKLHLVWIFLDPDVIFDTDYPASCPTSTEIYFVTTSGWPLFALLMNDRKSSHAMMNLLFAPLSP